jgi:superfamily II DNA/RNA helicase
VARASSTATTITQGLVASHGGGLKRETLRRLIREAVDLKNAIIFCNRKRDVAIVHKSLQKHGFAAGALHGDMDQRARMVSLDNFKNGDITLLVCSDVAARGLDITDVSHVFNFDVPNHAEDYVHRIGRTGRAGRLGTAYTIVTRADERYKDDIEKLINKKIDWVGPQLSELPEAEGGEDERPRGRGRDRGERGGRGRERGERRERPAREVAILEAASDEQPREIREPRRERPERTERAERPEQPRFEQPRRERFDRNNNNRGERRRYRDDDDGPPVIGLGDHVPSFLLRPVVLKPRKVEAETAPEEAPAEAASK